jgi:hypothetical protein
MIKDSGPAGRVLAATTHRRPDGTPDTSASFSEAGNEEN